MNISRTFAVRSFSTALPETVFLISSALLFNWFFWNEKLGINLFVYSFLVLLFFSWRNFRSLYNKTVLLVVSITFLSGLIVVIQNSILSIGIHILSLLLTVTFIQYEKFKAPYYAAYAVLLNFFGIPKKISSFFTTLSNGNPSIKKALYYLKLSLLPLPILIIYLLLFNTANPLFAHYLGNFFNDIFSFFEQLSIPRALFFAFGFLFSSGLILEASSIYISSEKEKNEKENVERKKQRLPAILRKSPAFSMPGLRNEYRTGLILLGLLNLLLFSVNFLDIKTLWFGFSVPVEFNLKEFVHKGTYLLILSIFLSIGILLYFFRGNLNFYPGNDLLKILAYVWTVQNAVLCISLFLRNYHYIAYHGLAYKRIGIFIFLLLTLIGLASLVIKIWKKKSLYFQLKANAWAVYLMLFAASFFNWDLIIVKHNLAHPNQKDIDVDFYHELSDRTMPYLYASLQRVEAQIEAHKTNKVRYIEVDNIKIFKERLDYRKNKYLEKTKAYSWLSFNLQDSRAIRLLGEVKE